MKRIVTIGLVAFSFSLPALAKEVKVKTSKVPAVVKELSSRYKLPQAVRLNGLSGVKAARDLADLVAIEQKFFPGAVVTSGFYDWRTVSRYRSRAGMHLGYDIAMPYGAPFGAGWPGVVTSIVVWSGEEHGITVQSPDGVSVTYGHVAPKVSVGQQVSAGQLLGTIARDHVDVKMRDAGGNYVDFGGSGRVLPSPQWASSAGGWMQPEASREALMAGWLLATNNRDVAQEEFEVFRRQAAQRKIEIEQLERRMPVLKKSVDQMAEYVEKGLVARVTVEENREELENAQKRLKKLKEEARGDSKQTQNLTQHLQAARDRLSQAKAQAERRGITFKQVEEFVERTVSNDRTLQKNVSAYKKAALVKNSGRLSKLENQIKDSERQLKALEDLFEIGGVAKNDLAAAREKHRLLVAQARALQAQTQE